MFIANNKNGDKIDVKEANKNEKYFCPICNEKLIYKVCKTKASHFAHKIKSDCVDWGDMSEWHLEWQERFPKECREVVLDDGIEKHRADVCIESSKTVIEFQHSNISEEDFQKRNTFYTKCGYNLIWIFDITGKLQKDSIYWAGKPLNGYRLNDFKTQGISWKRKKSTFNNYDNKKPSNINILLENENNENIPILLPAHTIDSYGASIIWLNDYIYKENFLKLFFPDKFENIKSINDIFVESNNIRKAIFEDAERKRRHQIEQQLLSYRRPVRRRWHL